MPELPEAETLVRGLRPHLEGRALTGVEVHHADVLRMPADAFRERIAGRRIRAVRRRAKNIVLDLDTGVVVVNLGMTGWLAPLGEGSALAESVTHPALTFGIEPSNRGAPTDTRRLVFDDIRRFGCVEALSDEEWSARSAQIGPEPLEPEFTAERLWSDLRSSRSPVRNWLLDQRRVAGVGNIYARPAGRPECTPAGPAATSPGARPATCTGAWSTCCARPSTREGPRSATTAMCTASAAASCIVCACTGARAIPVWTAVCPSSASC